MSSGDRIIQAFGDFAATPGATPDKSCLVLSKDIEINMIKPDSVSVLRAQKFKLTQDVKTGKTLWETRLGTSVQGFPITYSVNGKQYIAVSAGLGGGSPRMVPSVLAPDVHYPAYGNALYVFALRQ